MQKGQGILQRLADRADLPGEPLPGQPLLELAGDGRVLIENHYGVTCYSCQTIGVKVKYGEIRVSGASLKLIRMTREQLIISGKIENICIQRRKE